MDKICGIYKITSPSGKIYIGESFNINKRWKSYSRVECKGQTRLYNSLKKYGVENHIFEIVEECLFEDLKCRERYWQDFYDVIGKKGLNSRLTECGELKGVVSEDTRKKQSAYRITSGESYRGNNIKAELTLCLETGVYYSCAADAAEAYNLNPDILRRMLNGVNNNITSFIYVKNYYEGIKLPELTEHKNKTKKVIDIITKIIYESPKEVANMFNINVNTLKDKLKNRRQNNTNFMYLRDHMQGKTIPELNKRKTTGKQVIDTSTNITYESVKEVSTLFNLNYDNLKGKLNGNIKNNTSFRYL